MFDKEIPIFEKPEMHMLHIASNARNQLPGDDEPKRWHEWNMGHARLSSRFFETVIKTTIKPRWWFHFFSKKIAPLMKRHPACARWYGEYPNFGQDSYLTGGFFAGFLSHQRNGFPKAVETQPSKEAVDHRSPLQNLGSGCLLLLLMTISWGNIL